jgi:hypothetical protein
MLGRLGGVVAILAVSVFLVHASASLPNPRPDSRMVYASNSTGNDANDGLSAATPKKSIAAAAALLREGFPDWLLLRRGDEWNEGLSGLGLSGRSDTEPMVVTAFGTGAPPRLIPADGSQAWPDGPNVVMHGVDFPNDHGDTDAGVVLAPGSGWTGPTQQPGPVGDPGQAGYDAKAIARWDVVPFQTFNGTFEIGVVAFHMNGINRVDFAVDGGPWVSVYEMTLNPRTGVWEYWVSLDASRHNDGPVEVRAIVWPTVGEPRVLAGPDDASIASKNGNHSLFLNTNWRSSLSSEVVWCSPSGSDSTGDGTRGNPFKSISVAAASRNPADGLTIYLEPGSYSYGPEAYPRAVATMRAVTIEPGPGIDRDQVILNASAPGGVSRGIKLLRLHNLRIEGRPGLVGDYVWIDGCYVTGERTANYSLISPAWAKKYYVTDTFVTQSRNALRSADFNRNVHCGVISGSPFGGAAFTVNCRVDEYDNSGTNFHGDVFHWFPVNNTTENIIVYGVHAPGFNSQGIFAEVHTGNTLNNVAIVNTFIAKGEINSGGSWWETNTNHLLLWHVGLPDQPLRWAMSDYGTAVKNLSIRGSVFWHFSHNDPAQFENSYIENNHYISIQTYGAFASGSGYTVGDPMFADRVNGDFRPLPGSPLSRRMSPLLITSDIDAMSRRAVSSVGPYESIEE